jgi:hypothetical protein
VSNVLKMIPVVLLTLLVAIALVIGTRTAVARPVTATCQDDGSVHLGTCATQQECQNKCEAAHPEIPPNEIQGRCIGGCCTCLF